MAQSKDIILEKKSRCGLITFNRAKALNALSYDMIAQLLAQYPVWAADPDIYAVVMQSAGGRAFCSGGDIRALYEWNKAGELDTILRLYGTEYQNNWALDRFTKPHVALIDGIVMGGGVGVCIYGTHKVAGENFSFAMPEAGIGFFPDVGASYFLPRLEGEAGLYLALTGRQIGAADAYYLGLVTNCIPAAKFKTILEGLIEAEPVDPLLDGLHEAPGESELARTMPVINRIFSADSVEEVLGRLDAETGEWAGWARGVAGDIRGKSPTSLKVAFRLNRTGRTLKLDEALRLEYRVARRFFDGSEFYEGVRALIIDKDQKPKWSPTRLEEVSGEMVDAFLAPLEEDDLELGNPYFQSGGNRGNP